MSNLVVVSTEAIVPRHSDPGERRLAGDPKFTIWGVDSNADGSLVSGTWEATPGIWHSTYLDKWEFCTLVSN